MSKNKSKKKVVTTNQNTTPKKKVVTTTTNKKVVTTDKTNVSTKNPKIKPTSSRARSTSDNSAKNELIFGRTTYMWMGIGAALVALGMILMIGGNMDDPNQWDESQIYGFRQTVLAPFVILAGLIVEIYAIFKK